jgi:MFS family permease
MASSIARERWRPTRTNLIAGGIVIAGFWLSSLSWWFFLLVALGALGPGILREIGWLHDKDEFQRLADHRAGYHAFLTVGLLAFFLVALFRTGEWTIEHTERLPTLFLVLLWFTWFVSSMLDYWGPQKAAAWILRVFGSVVLVFTIVSNLGSEWTGWAGLLLSPLLAAPFFVLAWLAGRWPRVSGFLLLVVSGCMFWFFGWFRSNALALITQGVTIILFLGPLIAAGVVLLLSGKQDDGFQDEQDLPITEDVNP